MKPKVYIETTVVSYLASRPSRDVVVAGHQQITRDWWQSAKDRFHLVASELVIREAEAGDPIAANARLELLSQLDLLDVTREARRLAEQLVRNNAIPPKAVEDAGHIAISVVNAVDYLVTWNCKHIANATMRHKIDEVCRESGYVPTIICTPDELMEVSDD